MVYTNELEDPHLSFELAIQNEKIMIQAKTSTEFSDTSPWLEPRDILHIIGHFS